MTVHGALVHKSTLMKGCLTQRVLVLNRLWQAVNIVSAKRAFGLLFQDHAKVIYSGDDGLQVYPLIEWIDFSIGHPAINAWDCVHTIRYTIRVPKVLLLDVFDRLPMKEVKFTRQNLFERDNYTCQYCGRTYSVRSLNLDHVIPRDRGGRTTWENIVTACMRCNTRKANRLPHEASMYLRHKPERPRWRPFVSFVIGSEIDESWNHFLTISRS